MYMRKSQGRRLEPWGTPHRVTKDDDEDRPLLQMLGRLFEACLA